MRREEVRDTAFGLLGRVAFAAAPGRSATGGVRAVESLDGLDLDALAETMARKYAFLPFPKNGAAKAAIVLPAGTSPGERRERLRAFGRQLAAPVRAGRYRPWTDIGTTEQDLREIYSGAGAAAPAFGDSGTFTAYSVAGVGLGVCDRLGVEPSRARAAIQGFGSVGRELAATLARLGMRVVAISNRAGTVAAPEGLETSAAIARGEDRIEVGGARGPPEAIFDVHCDVFFACADARLIDLRAARAIAAQAVVPAANDPCAAGAEDALLERGILFVPDFVANTGGILGSFLSSFGVDRALLERFMHEAWRGVARRLLDLAARRGVPVAACAREEIDPSLRMSWFRRKAHGLFYRLSRGPEPVRRVAGEVALSWARRALEHRFREP